MTPLLLLALTASEALSPVTRDKLCVTTGAIETREGHLLIEASEVRATVLSGRARTVEARLRYLGPSATTTPLASGELRRQIGLKLRSLNQCNLLYVMWHIEPDAKLAVSIKSNPGESTHQECDARGYLTIKPAASIPTPSGGPLNSGTWRSQVGEATSKSRTTGTITKMPQRP